MAVKPQIKANQLAKDLNLKSKEITDIMAGKGIELKTQKALEPHEFDVLFDAITSAHQIEGIDDYIDGVTFIPSKLEKVEKKAPVKEEPAKEIAVEEKKTGEPAKAKPEEKQNKSSTPAAKVEKAAQPDPKVKETVAAKTESATNNEPKKEAVKEEAKKPAESAAPAIKTQPKVDRAEALARAAAIEKAAQQKAAQRAAQGGNQDNRQRPDNNRRPEAPRRDNNKPAFEQKPQSQQFQQPQQRNQPQTNDRFSRMGTPNFDRQAAPQRRDDRKPQKPQAIVPIPTKHPFGKPWLRLWCSWHATEAESICGIPSAAPVPFPLRLPLLPRIGRPVFPVPLQPKTTPGCPRKFGSR